MSSNNIETYEKFANILLKIELFFWLHDYESARNSLESIKEDLNENEQHIKELRSELSKIRSKIGNKSNSIIRNIKLGKGASKLTEDPTAFMLIPVISFLRRYEKVVMNLEDIREGKAKPIDYRGFRRILLEIDDAQYILRAVNFGGIQLFKYDKIEQLAKHAVEQNGLKLSNPPFMFNNVHEGEKEQIYGQRFRLTFDIGMVNVVAIADGTVVGEIFTENIENAQRISKTILDIYQ